jgi:hypothetical protein
VNQKTTLQKEEQLMATTNLAATLTIPVSELRPTSEAKDVFCSSDPEHAGTVAARGILHLVFSL